MFDSHHPRHAADALDDAAAHWFARRDAGLSATEQLEFEHWLAADPRHAAVWREFEEALQDLHVPRDHNVAAAMSRELSRRQRRRQRKRRGAIVSATLAVAAAGVLMFFRAGEVSRAPDLAPATSSVVVTSPKREQLPDGTIAELNEGARIEVTFSATQRRVHLLQGEGYFAVTTDAARPFVVEVHGVEVKAIGTAFSVGLAFDQVDVLVTHGRVAVARTPDAISPTSAHDQSPVIAEAGSRVRVPTTGQPQPWQIETLGAEEREHELAWRGPRLDLSATPLAEAVSVFNQHGGTQLRIADRALGELRMSGVFRADNAEGFARMLELNYEIRAERNSERMITLRRAR